jgi:hypothetical protein
MGIAPSRIERNRRAAPGRNVPETDRSVLYHDFQVRADLTTLQMVSSVPPIPHEQALQDLLTTLGLSG